MGEEEKARLILEGMDEVMMIDWNLEKFYLKAIKKGLKKIEVAEEKDKKRS